ncbi:hypothetical protein [Planctomicrobium piriforme]|uniref:Uncharacterized protein n=1 Tax=Planctomicrobium piriforme TaxID=1576369 RepID=A0A1I3FBQ8_9PLAN|nr:hypothetical protein [Planctomicrobium piriforme]SFI08666.1 hypothetical protein SAMN05421753_105168 [Planctomicrobium piriforme]
MATTNNRAATLLRRVAAAMMVIAAIVLVNGVISFYWRYNFITQETYGPSLVPVYICFAGVVCGVLGLTANTIAGALESRTTP